MLPNQRLFLLLLALHNPALDIWRSLRHTASVGFLACGNQKKLLEIPLASGHRQTFSVNTDTLFRRSAPHWKAVSVEGSNPLGENAPNLLKPAPIALLLSLLEQ